MNLFTGMTTISVTNLAAAVPWYKEKFALKEPKRSDPEYTQLETRDREFVITLCSGAQEPDEPPPIINTSSVAKAREWLSVRGVNVTPVQTDRQGTHYIEMRDLENNLIEISEEP